MPILYMPTYPVGDNLIDHKCALPSSEDAPKGTIYQCDNEDCGKLYRLKDSQYPVKTGLIWTKTNKIMLYILPVIYFFKIEFTALKPNMQKRAIASHNQISYYKER